MGRTKRERERSRKESLPVQVQEADNVLLHEYLGKNYKWKNETRLVCHRFKETERGVCSKINKSSDSDVLIKLPLDSLITCRTILSDNVFMTHLRGQERIFTKMKFQALLAMYIIYNDKIDDSKYKPYLATLPRTLTNPYFCNRNELYHIPLEFIENIAESKKTISSFFKCYEPWLTSLNITLQDFEWAYFIVNTRSVHVPNQQYSADELELFLDEPHYGLAPFLDMFNHSSNAKTKVEVLENNYSLLIDNQFKKYEEIFINYGTHNNFKLMADYGFFSSSNDDDYFEIHMRDIQDLLQSNQLSKKLNINNKKFKFIRDHNLDTSLFFNQAECISYNLAVLLFLIFKESCNFSNILSQTAFGSNVTEIMNSVSVEAKLLINHKINELKTNLTNLEKIESLSTSGKTLVKYLEYCIFYLNNCLIKIDTNCLRRVFLLAALLICYKH